ncbi:tetraspanin-7-like [Schistocerca serialis cubense]|uniref:tetraspanin-7-like n=1 Tax=Schistocerca serialis cubense TaxID=2023355 RepID=UPI00214E11AA|nr:tetraspanin-7-like [Schistocerca serialis cubense]
MNKRLQTVAAMACMKTLLMLFNFLFWLTGIAILAAGIWLEVELYKYMELSTEFSRSAPYVLLGAGALIVLVGSLACCCTVKGQPALLYIYGAFLLVIFILEVGAAVSIYAYRGHLQAGFDRGLTQALHSYDTDPEKKECFDLMQSTLHCCGNRNYTDWPDKVPTSCCKVDKCDTSDVSEIYTQGCYTLVVDFLNTNIGLVAGAAAGVAVIPLLGVVLACCLARNINKAKYEQMA